jgi:DNA topoisomerase II
MAPPSNASKYQKLDHREHILKRPNMYIGNIDKDVCDTWLLQQEATTMVRQNITYIPGLYKIFDEILVNALDHAVRLKSCSDTINQVKNIKVTICKDTGYIEILNDGDGIDVEMHPEHQVYIPEMIFGHLLTSANYDDKQDRTIGGQNGIGAKACNVFSKHFIIETVDGKRRKFYRQEFSENMSTKLSPEIKSCTKKPYTMVRFLPDYAKFMCTNLSDDMYNLMVKRTYDACAVTDNDVNVFLNDKKLEYKNFEKYVDLYLGPKSDAFRVFEKIDDRWEVVASLTKEPGFEQVSFVNGIWTIRGGKHVDYICNQVVKKLIDLAQKKKKDVSIKPQHLKDNLMLFVKSTIVNPNFDSQTKETLTTPFSKFGSRPEVSDKFIEKLYKSGIVERAVNIGAFLDTKNLKKTDGKKKSVIRGMAKLEDANWAGTSRSAECTLILTEGDSAKTMAMSGIDEVGRDRYGVFPLKGKLLNVKDCAVKKIAENEEITNLKKILGLESDKTYTDVSDLRYGKIMCMTDSDADGSHIKGLLFNMFQTLWPSLFKHQDFLNSMLTPIVKVKKGTNNIEFYNITDYENWKAVHDNGAGWHVKYYKGLGTSNADEARDYFRNLKIVKYIYESQTSDMSIDLAFNKKRADDRKSWLGDYDKQRVLDYTVPEVSFESFINNDLIHFSNYDVKRSIPSLCDGLKVSQRKILYCCFKKDWSKECRVAQLAAYVSENSAYHHGEESLNNAIISMAQDFMGSNNINLLSPNGQFGSRIKGGKDSSSPRYIHTELSAITKKIFRKEDLPILEYLDDDGLRIEPEFYVPLIPMILVNGAVGIGTGFSTSVPSYNPKDIIRCIRSVLQGDAPTSFELKPWYMGFKGTIVEANGKLFSKGVFEKIAATKVRIKELPVGVWTEDFKELLEQMLETKDYLKNYESYYNDVKVDFVLHFTSAEALDNLLTVDDNGFTNLDNEFKLVSSKGMTTTNMYLFNAAGQIHKYDNVHDIICEFVTIRRAMYGKRKEHQIATMEYDLVYLNAKLRFINEVISGTISLYNKPKKDIEKQLKAGKYPPKDDSYDYLVGMPIYNLTAEKKLNIEHDLATSVGALNAVKNTSQDTMWLEDLAEFEVAYDRFVVAYDASLNRKLMPKKQAK